MDQSTEQFTEQSTEVRIDSSDSENFQPVDRPNADDERVSWVYRRGYAIREAATEGGFRIHCLRKNCGKSFRTKDGSTSNIRRHLNKKHGKFEKVDPPGTRTTVTKKNPINHNQNSTNHNPTTITNTTIGSNTIAAAVTTSIPKPLVATPVKPVVKKQKTKPAITSAPPTKVKKMEPVKLNEDGLINCKLIELCLLNRIPFRSLDLPSFSSMVKRAINTTTLPSGQQLLQYLPVLFREKYQEVHHLLQQQPYISVSCNIWTSPYSNDFLAITAHFIDAQWKKRELLIGFENLEASYSGMQLAQKLLLTLEQYGILNRLFSIITDSSAYMNEMVHTVTEVSSRRGDFTFSKPKQHILCLGEVIDFSAQCAIASALGYASLEGPPGISQLITASLTTVVTTPLTKLCAALAIIKQPSESSGYLTELWQTFYQKRPILVSDIVKRWGATYSLIGKVVETAEEYNNACIHAELSELQLSHLDCNFLKELHAFLKHFFVLTVFLSTTRYPSLNRTFRVYELLLKHLVENSTPGKSNHIIQAACQAHARLDIHFKSLADKTAYSVSLAMDPRLKYSFWRDTLDDYNKASRCIADVEAIWSSEFKPNVKDETNSSQPDLFESFFSYNRKRIQDDLERYIAEDLADNDLLSPSPELDYWRTSAPKFPTLATMARKYLAIPATSSPCEFTFSNLLPLLPDFLHGSRPTEIRESLLLESWFAPQP